MRKWDAQGNLVEATPKRVWDAQGNLVSGPLPSLTRTVTGLHREAVKQITSTPVGAVKAVAGLTALPFQLATPPSTPVESFVSAVGGFPALTAKRLGWDPQVVEYERAQEAANKGQTA